MGIFTKDIMVASARRFMKSRAVRRALLRNEIKERIKEGRIQTRLFMPRKYQGISILQNLLRLYGADG
jgi:hypothetical protein